MKKILLLLSILLSSVLSMAQSTGSLPYWTLMPSRDTLVSGDSLIFHYETTGKYVKIAWNDFKNLITPDSVDLSNYIKRDGTSAETTGSINIGDGFGFRDTSSLYNSRSVIAGLDFFKSDPFYFGSRPLRMHAGSTDYRTTFSVADDGWISNCTDNFGNNSYSYSSSLTGFFTSQYNGSSSGYMSFSNQGLRINAAAGSGVSRYGLIRTSLFTGSGTHTYELPNKGGTFAMTSDIVGSTYSFGSIVVSSNITTLNDSLYTLVSNATFTDPSPVEGKGFTVFIRNGTGTIGGTTYSVAGSVIRRVFHSGAWANYSNVPISGTSGVSYNSTTGAISFNLGTSNTWTAQQTATSWVANGTGGAGYLQLASQSSTPAAVNGSMILYSDASNRFSIVRRNNANSADITRTHVYPDASYSYNFPTPASGSTSTLAGLETAQTFTQTQTFPIAQATSYKLFTGTVYNDIITFSTDPIIGDGFPRVRAKDFYPLTTTTYDLGSASSSWRNAFVTSISSVANAGLPVSTANTTAVSSGVMTFTTGNQNSATAGLFSGQIYLKTGNITNAGALSSQYTSSIFLETGTATGSATRGGVVFFGGNTEPIWNGLQRGFFIGNATAAPTGNPTSGAYVYTSSGDLNVRSSGGGITTVGTAGVSMQTAGQGLLVKEGTNATLGTATLTGGTTTVNTTKVTANSRIFVTIQSPSGTLGTVYISARTAGTSFTITSTSALDTSTVAWFIVEPN